jgi:hypothetical protein
MATEPIVELEAALQQIARFCQRRKLKKNQEFFDQIASRILENVPEKIEDEQRFRLLLSRYQAAVSTLLLLADPPAAGVLDAALGRINSTLSSRRPANGVAEDSQKIKDVRIIDGVGAGYMLRDALPQRRELTEDQRAICARFRPSERNKSWPNAPTPDWGLFDK